VADSKNFSTFDEYLKNPNADVFCPDTNARKDGFCLLQLVDGSFRPVFMEWKLRQTLSNSTFWRLWLSNLIAGEVNEAIYTTRFDSSYTTKKTHSPLVGHRQKKQRVEELLVKNYAADEGCLRILFFFPEERDLYCPKIEGNDIVVTLDKFYSPELFDEKVWKFLDALKFAWQTSSVSAQIK